MSDKKSQESIIKEMEKRIQELEENNLKLTKENVELKKLSTTDSLTGLHNRASFDDHMALQLSLSRRNGKPFSLIIIDLDKFKDVNDKYGHLEGDKVLKSTSKTLQNDSRGYDVACRFGGEELILILPETSPDEALIVAEKFRRKFESMTYTSSKGEEYKVTASFGVSSSTPEDTASELFKRADEAVYRSKDNGRNRVSITENESTIDKIKIINNVGKNGSRVSINDDFKNKNTQINTSEIDSLFESKTSKANTNTNKNRHRAKHSKI